MVNNSNLFVVGSEHDGMKSKCLMRIIYNHSMFQINQTFHQHQKPRSKHETGLMKLIIIIIYNYLNPTPVGRLGF